MAIYHFSGTVISRSQGRNAVVSAAYRSAEKLYDEHQEKTADFSRKQDVIYKEIMLPEGAPEWMSNRDKLWNGVEAIEKRKDAQLAREFNFALPKELTHEQNITLAREFVASEFVARGMVADLCIHDGKTKDGENQPHAHVMLALRDVTAEGFGKKNREWNAKENLCLWREAWAEYTNKHLALNGVDQRIDHRTLGEQGINLEAQRKIGPDILRVHETRIEDHLRIARENGERILADPNIALNAITRQQSTFTHQDLARFINRHTADAEQFQTVYETVKVSSQVIALGKDEQDRERFTTKGMLDLEKKMLNNVFTLERRGHGVESVRELGIERALERARGTKETERLGSAVSLTYLSEQQKDGLSHIVEAGDIKCLIGYAGTGKSHLLSEARTMWEGEGYKVLGATLSGIAAENLEGASGIASRTIASRSYYWDRGEHLTNKDILVVDEAGMIGSRQMARLVEEVKDSGAKLVLIGDPQQLQAIEAGAAFRAISEQTGYISLTEIRRQHERWQQEATKEFATRQTEAAINRYDQHDHVHVFETQAVAKTALVEMWNDARLANGEKTQKTQIMLAYTRRDVQELNEMARDLRKQNNELGEDQKLQTNTGEKSFAEGDRIYFLKNDRSLGVMNGTLGTIDKLADERITVRLDKDDLNGNQKVITFNLRDYNNINHGYAATIHKAQGVTVDRSYILASKHLDAHATYVGMARHKESADLFWSKEEFANQREMIKTIGRDRSKDVTLDYLDRDLKEGREINEPTKEHEIKSEKAQEKREKSVQDLVKELRELGKTHGKEKGNTEQEYVRELQKLNQEAEIRNEKLDAKDYQYTREIKALQGMAEREKREMSRVMAAMGRIYAKEDRYASAPVRDLGLSSQEKRAAKLVDKYQALEGKYEHAQERGHGYTKTMAKEHLDRCAQEISNDKSTMNYLQKNDKELFKEINNRSKELSRELQKGLELEL